MLGLDLGAHFVRGAVCDVRGEIRARQDVELPEPTAARRARGDRRPRRSLLAAAGASRRARSTASCSASRAQSTCAGPHLPRDEHRGPRGGRDSRPRSAARLGHAVRDRERHQPRRARRAVARRRARRRRLRVHLDRHRPRRRDRAARRAAPRPQRLGRRARLRARRACARTSIRAPAHWRVFARELGAPADTPHAVRAGPRRRRARAAGRRRGGAPDRAAHRADRGGHRRRARRAGRRHRHERR